MMEVVCCRCGHRTEVDDKRARDIAAAAKVNKDGPYCDRCREAEMTARGLEIDRWNRSLGQP